LGLYSSAFFAIHDRKTYWGNHSAETYQKQEYSNDDNRRRKSLLFHDPTIYIQKQKKMKEIKTIMQKLLKTISHWALQLMLA